MSARSRRSSSSRAQNLSEDDIITDLTFKLQALLPHLNQRQPSRRLCVWMQGQEASKILKETCSYIRKLEREVNELSERLSTLLDAIDDQDLDVDSIRTLLQQL
ncbi:Transcription factor PRE5 [Linum grandiflorum]